MIVIGLGAGRTGTASLAKFIDNQKGAVCFHEMNPSCMVFEGNPQPVLNTISEFRKILAGGDTRLLTVDYSFEKNIKQYRKLQENGTPSIIGDVALYHLKYIPDIAAADEDVRFICMKRDKAGTVKSWIKHTTIKRWPSLWAGDRFKSIVTRTAYYKERNFWQEHDGSIWAPDPVWGKCFPKFGACSKKEAIEKYWDYYYEEADRLSRRFHDRFRIFSIDAMNDSEKQKAILSFIGIKESDMNLERVHTNSLKR